MTRIWPELEAVALPLDCHFTRELLRPRVSSTHLKNSQKNLHVRSPNANWLSFNCQINHTGQQQCSAQWQIAPEIKYKVQSVSHQCDRHTYGIHFSLCSPHPRLWTSQTDKLTSCQIPVAVRILKANVIQKKQQETQNRLQLVLSLSTGFRRRGNKFQSNQVQPKQHAVQNSNPPNNNFVRIFLFASHYVCEVCLQNA